MASSSSRAADHELVSFAKPPVEEVALALQFTAQVIDLEVFADFTIAVRSELPKRAYQPPIPPMEELFDMPRGVPSFHMTFDTGFALPRTWFVSRDDTWLVQLQADRITVNWRRLQSPEPYPRYSEVRGRLVRYLDVLGRSLTRTGIDEPRINFSEITYVNSIAVEGAVPGQTQHPHTAAFLRDVRPWRGRRFLPEPEDLQVQARWRIPNEAGTPVGRLYLSLNPGFRPLDMMPIYMMNLTSRVIPGQEDQASALEALDLGHRWIVLGFEDLTTTKMQEIWEKRGRS